jgi:hypothetical protein
MEQVLHLYPLPPFDTLRTPDYPQVCLDEARKQLIAEVCPPRPGRPGQPYRYEAHYRREGVRQLFMVYEPLAGWRHVAVRHASIPQHRAAVDWAEVIAEVLEVHYPQAKRVRRVLDQLNTHVGGDRCIRRSRPSGHGRCMSGWSSITPPNASIPQHGSWLNMAEIELSVLTGQCLDRRIGSEDELRREVTAWEPQRNAAKAQTDWRFTTAKARIKLKKLYPTLKA